MIDLEINKALALAIGWTDWDMCEIHKIIHIHGDRIKHAKGIHEQQWQRFDYRDWDVIGPIAERYDCFPARIGLAGKEWCAISNQEVRADTPQKAIAMAVIKRATQ